MRKTLKSFLQKIGLLNAVIRGRDFLRSTSYLQANWKYWRTGAEDGLAIPPLQLISLVTGVPDIAGFLESGRNAAECIRSVAQKNGIGLEDLNPMLDFGCGCGRVIRHWSKSQIAVCGCDYNPVLIEWCRKNLLFADFKINRLDPPLPFDDSSFGCVYALSVFTHMPQNLQDSWIEELSRILKSGGFLLITTHGEYYLKDLDDAQKAQFKSGNLVVKELGAPGSNHFGAYHPFEYVQRRLARSLEIVDFISEGATGNPRQDLYLLRKSK